MVYHFERVHPGSILADELKARNMTPNALAVAIRVPANRIDQIVKGKRAISAETALRLGRFLGTGPDIWLNMQSGHDLWKAEQEFGAKIRKEIKAA